MLAKEMKWRAATRSVHIEYVYLELVKSYNISAYIDKIVIL